MGGIDSKYIKDGIRKSKSDSRALVGEYVEVRQDEKRVHVRFFIY